MREIILGLPGPWAEDCREKSDHYTTKIGGLPDWPISEVDIASDLLKCALCGGKLCVVAQVYAPILSSRLKIEERVLYILGCTMPDCGNDPRSWRAIRAQKCDDGMQLSSCNQNSSPLVEKTSLAPISSNPSEEHLQTNGIGDQGDDSDSDLDLEELSRALSEAASLASQSKKQNGSKNLRAAEKRPVAKPSRAVDTDIPVLPCFYIFSQTERYSGAIDTLCENYPLLSINGSHGLSSDQEEEERWEGQMYRWDGEMYEYDRALGADRTYLKFKKQVDAYPKQCFRYSYGGNPLLAKHELGKPDNCRLCGSSRQFEMQLMPPLLYFLHQASDGLATCSPENWNWDTLLVYSCSKSCCASSCKDKSGSCSWTLAEEAIILQDE